MLPFDASRAVVQRIVDLERSRQWLFKRELPLLDAYLRAVGIVDPVQVERARRERCQTSVVKENSRRYRRLPRPRLARELPLGEALERILAASSPVLLVGAHFGAGALPLSQIDREALIITRFTSGILRLPPQVRVASLVEMSGTQVTLDALAMLRKGGVVFVAGDGEHVDPRMAVDVSILGRRISLPRGFADMMLASGVPATPMFSRVDGEGRIVTWVEPPLDDGGAADRMTRVRALVQTYADHLSRHFAAYPGNIMVQMMERYLAAPAVSSSEVFGAALAASAWAATFA